MCAESENASEGKCEEDCLIPSKTVAMDLLDDALNGINAVSTLLYALSESIEEITSPADALYLLSNEVNAVKKIAEARELMDRAS